MNKLRLHSVLSKVVTANVAPATYIHERIGGQLCWTANK